MATANCTRRSAGSSLSAQSDEFASLSRRLLVTVNHIVLVSQHFGDLADLPPEHVTAGMTLCEAAKDLDRLYEGSTPGTYAMSTGPRLASDSERSPTMARTGPLWRGYRRPSRAPSAAGTTTSRSRAKRMRMGSGTRSVAESAAPRRLAARRCPKLLEGGTPGLR